MKLEVELNQLFGFLLVSHAKFEYHTTSLRMSILGVGIFCLVMCFLSLWSELMCSCLCLVIFFLSLWSEA
jgi:hypothetical protein